MRGDFWRIIAIVVWIVISTGKGTTAETPAELRLINLAKTYFANDLKPAEEKLFRGATNGVKTDCTKGSNTEDDPANASQWEDDRLIRADRLVWLCTDPEASALVTSSGLEIAGARIEGRVNLAWAKILFPIRTFKCAFAETIVLDRSFLRSVHLQFTFIKGLDGDALSVEREIFFGDRFRAEGGVWLRKAFAGDQDTATVPKQRGN